MHTEGGLVLKRHTDVGTGINDALVGNGDGSHGIIHGIVAVLGQRLACSRHDNRPACHICSIEPDHATRAGLILTDKDKLVLIAELLCHRQCRVIQLGIDIILGYGIVIELASQVLAEGLHHRENDLTCR